MVARQRAVIIVMAWKGVRAGPQDLGMPLGCEPAGCFRAGRRDGSPLVGSHYFNGLERSSSRPPGCEHAFGLRPCCSLARACQRAVIILMA